VFGLISLLHRIQSFVDTTKGWDRYPYLAYCSSESIASTSSLVRSRCWYVGVSDLLASVGITMDRLPPFRYSLDAPGHLLPTRQEMNTIIREDIYRQFVQVTWINPQGGLRPKMAFYVEHFMVMRDGLIVRPHYTLRHWIFFFFFGEMKQGKGSLGLGKRLKHSFTPISLILFLISSISLLRGF
jgi:hypothetical protein